jgi:hypothetical protein
VGRQWPDIELADAADVTEWVSMVIMHLISHLQGAQFEYQIFVAFLIPIELVP